MKERTPRSARVKHEEQSGFDIPPLRLPKWGWLRAVGLGVLAYVGVNLIDFGMYAADPFKDDRVSYQGCMDKVGELRAECLMNTDAKVANLRAWVEGELWFLADDEEEFNKYWGLTDEIILRRATAARGFIPGEPSTGVFPVQEPRWEPPPGPVGTGSAHGSPTGD